MKKIHRRYEKRSGVMLFAVLACISIALALTLAAMQSSLNQRRHLSRTLQLEQTRLLLEAAANSQTVKNWSEAEDDAEERKPLKIELQLPSGKRATVTAAVKPNQEEYLLTAMIGDADNQISTTRRSISASLKSGVQKSGSKDD